MKKGIAVAIMCLPLYTVFAQSVGIGIIAPVSLLHVSDGSPGINPSPIAVAAFESDGDMGINLLTPSDNESGIFFGNPIHTAHGGIVYNSSTPFGLAFRTGGNNTRMVLTSSGRVGIGTIDPSDHVHINTLFAFSNNPFGVTVNGSVKFRIWGNGGTSVGSASMPATDGLYITGPLEPSGGIISSTDPIRIESTTDSIEIKAGSSKIVVHANGAIRIVAAGGQDILIDAGSGDLTLKGANVQIESSMDTEIEAGLNLQMSSTVITDVMGSIVRLNQGTVPIAKQGSTVSVAGATGVVSGNVSPTVLTQ